MDSTSPDDQARIVFFSHGGGPLPILGDPSHQAMLDFMKKLPTRLRKPDAILVISAHWEESAATLLGAMNPPMFYDYYGFPEEAYTITYPAPGSPELAGRIAGILKANAIPSRLDPKMGYLQGHSLFFLVVVMLLQCQMPLLLLPQMRCSSPGHQTRY